MKTRQLLFILMGILAFTTHAQTLTEVPDKLFLVGLSSDLKTIDYDGIEFNREGNIFTLENIRGYSEGDGTQRILGIGILYDYTPGKPPYNFFYYKNHNTIKLTTDTESRTSELVPQNNNSITWIRMSVPSTFEYFNYTVDLSDLENPTLTASLYKEQIPTGIDEVSIENGEVRWYNISGIPVSNPSSGLYIRIQNGSAELVQVK